MGFAVYHTAKGKGSGGGLSNHIDRTEGKEYSYRNADPTRRHLNVELANKMHSSIPIQEAVENRIKAGYNGKRKIRTDAVKYITHILSGSHAEMIKIFQNPKLKTKWVNENAKFIKEEFGESNVMRFTLHLDEKTPHIHVVTVPLTEDGRLSAKEVIGDKNALERRQDRYAERMKQFGLQRGLKRTGVKHETAEEYQKRKSELDKVEPIETQINVSKGVLGNIKQETIDEAERRLKNASNILKTMRYELKQAQNKAKTASNKNASYYELREAYDELKQDISTLKRQNTSNLQSLKGKFHNLILDDEALNKFRSELISSRIETHRKKRGRGL